MEVTDERKTAIMAMDRVVLDAAIKLLRRLAVLRAWRETVAVAQIFEGEDEMTATLKCQASVKIWKLDEDELAKKHFNPLFKFLTEEYKKKSKAAEEKKKATERQKLQAYLGARAAEGAPPSGDVEHLPPY